MSNLRVRMAPHLSYFDKTEHGIKRVVEAYFKYLPKFGIELVDPTKDNSYDLTVAHAGIEQDADIAHCHGLYWTAEHDAPSWEWHVNANVIAAVRNAKRVSVPSTWVAETFQRDMRFTPEVIGHGIDWDEWQHDRKPRQYVLWNKNRAGDVCDPRPVGELARRFPNITFVTTFAPPIGGANINITGLLPHNEMKALIQESGVYLATTLETFGIGILEAMAAGVPVLGFAHGGILDLVGHGVNGYLARVGDWEDLARGLSYCLEHRRVLGENGREIAREWTWEAAVEKASEMYYDAVQDGEPTVAIVIPSYNYSGRVSDAIESAVNQDYDLLTDIVVVDDGSEDDGATREVVSEWSQRDQRVRYIRQENSGVAVARNRGVVETDTKYVCCLDADDKIRSDYLGLCVPALEADDGLGIAYTKLTYVKPDGSTGVSKWPDEWDFGQQLRRRNQVPTCCVYRREMWDRLGGYRQRYAPHGAGAEDAEFWLRSGAYGWKAKLVSREPAFIYSWQSGRVSGDPNYKEVDWLSWHPWAQDGKHPFASYAMPIKASHPVRRYDNPVVSVVIPVGPGHWELLLHALDSLEAQRFRKWEAIVVNDTGEPVPPVIENAYPYVRFSDTGQKGAGPGAARNVGAAMARGPLLLFLDADDHMVPEALSEMVDAWSEHESIVYSDYVVKAYIDDPNGLDETWRRNLVEWDEKTNVGVIRHYAKDYNCDWALQQPKGERPYDICTITALHPTAWWREIGGFDESMPSWEDIEYWWRMARHGHCFVRIPEPLLCYRLYAGERREVGSRAHKELMEYVRNKYEQEGKPMGGCSGCGGKTSTQSSPRRHAVPTGRNSAAVVRSGAMRPAEDTEFVWVKYHGRNRGKHGVMGAARFSTRIQVTDVPGVVMQRVRGAWVFHYGRHAGGDKILVHRADAEQNPHLFEVLDIDGVRLPKDEAGPPPPPLPVEEDGFMPVVPQSKKVDNGDDEVPEPPTAQATRVKTPEERVGAIPGVTPEVAQTLVARGIKNARDVAALDEETLAQQANLGMYRARIIVRSARKAAEREAAIAVAAAASSPFAEDGAPIDSDPADLTVKEIKGLEMTGSQWKHMLERERQSKDRKTAVAFLEKMVGFADVVPGYVEYGEAQESDDEPDAEAETLEADE